MEHDVTHWSEFIKVGRSWKKWTESFKNLIGIIFCIVAYNVKLLILGKRQVEKGIARFKPDKGDTNNYDEPLILTEESTATVEKVIGECEAKYGQVSPRNKYVPPGAQVGYTMILPKAKELPAWWRGMEHDPATQVGMDDKYAYERMSQYLWINSRRQMVSVSNSVQLI